MSADRDHQLIDVIASLTPGDQYVDTESFAHAMFAADKASGRPALMYPNSGPWYGFDRELRGLQDSGLIDIDPGIAEFVPQGAPTPSAKHFFVGLTEKGRVAHASEVRAS